MSFLRILKDLFCKHDWQSEKFEYTTYDRLTDTDRTYLRLTWICPKCEADGGQTGCIIQSVCHKCNTVVWSGGPRVEFCRICYPGPYK